MRHSIQLYRVVQEIWTFSLTGNRRKDELTHCNLYNLCKPKCLYTNYNFLWLLLGCNQYWAGLVYVLCGFMAERFQKAQPAVVMV